MYHSQFPSIHSDDIRCGRVDWLAVVERRDRQIRQAIRRRLEGEICSTVARLVCQMPAH
jgi:hypothetical protein